MPNLPQVTLDANPIQFVVPGQEGFTIDLLDAVLLIEQVSDTYQKDFADYWQDLAAELEKSHKAKLRAAQLFKFVEAVSAAYTDYKKKLDNELPLALGLAVTPSESTDENT